MLASSLMENAWKNSPSIYEGRWGVFPHDMVASGYALVISLDKENDLSFELRTAYILSISTILQEILVNGKLFVFNQVDVFLIDQIILSYFHNCFELDEKHQLL